MVKRLLAREVASSYGPVVTLGKMNLFIPWRWGRCCSWVTQRQATGRCAVILLAALAATMLPGLLLTVVYAAFPGPLVQGILARLMPIPAGAAGGGAGDDAVCRAEYLANYALSAERRPLLPLSGWCVGPGDGLFVWHETLLQVAW